MTYNQQHLLELSGINGYSLKQAKELGIVDDNLGFVQKDLYKQINKIILDYINKEGELPWRKPWRDGYKFKGHTYGPQNYVTASPYRGGNAAFIAMYNYINGTQHKYFLTAKQVRERGGVVKPDAVKFHVFVFLKTEKVKTDSKGLEYKTEEVGIIPYVVYSLSDTEGVKPIKRKDAKTEPAAEHTEVLLTAQTLVDNMPKRPPITNDGGNRAYYSVNSDSVHMPVKKAFEGIEKYYGVLFHELVHSTGHPKRLKRQFGRTKGDKLYAFEELIAELGASYLCGTCGIEYYTLNNTAAYLKSWGSKFKSELAQDKSFFFRAVLSATRAAKYIIGESLEKHGEIFQKDKHVEPEKPAKTKSDAQKAKTVKAGKGSSDINHKPKESFAKPVGNKFFIAVMDGRPAYKEGGNQPSFSLAEDAKQVTIPGFEQFEFFTHKQHGDWRVSEGRTGLAVAQYAKTRQQAIDQAKAALEKHGVEAVARSFETQASKGLISPRYNPEQKSRSVDELDELAAKAIADLSKLKQYKALGKKGLQHIYWIATKNHRNGYTASVIEELENTGILEPDTTPYELTEKGWEVAGKIASRSETIRAKQSGSDLFPDMKGLGSVDDIGLSVIKQYAGMHGQIVTGKQLRKLLNTLQKAIKAKHINKKHPYAKELLKIQDQLVKACTMEQDQFHVEITNVKRFQAIVNNELNGVKPQLGMLPDIAAAAIGKGIEIIAKKAFKKKSEQPVATETTKQPLSGLGFVRADHREVVKSPDTFRLPGELGKFLLDIQPYKLAITVSGDPHAGKTEFITQLADAFLATERPVAMFMLEQGGMESVDTREAIDRNIKAERQAKLQVTGEADRGIDSVREAAASGHFKVIIVDSWQKLKIPATKFDDLRHEFPNIIWVVIFQQNGEGGTRGGVASDYDAPIQLKVRKVDKTFKNNYVEAIKNRGNPESLQLRYMILDKKTVLPKPNPTKK